MAPRHRSGVVPRLFRHGRDRVSSPSLGHGDRRRPDPNIQRGVSPKALGLVQLPGSPGWSHSGSGLRAAGMAMVIHQPRARASGARQDAGLEVPKSDCGAWRETGLHRPGVSNRSRSDGSEPECGSSSRHPARPSALAEPLRSPSAASPIEQHIGSHRWLSGGAHARRRISTPGCRASSPCRRGCPGCRCRGTP